MWSGMLQFEIKSEYLVISTWGTHTSCRKQVIETRPNTVLWRIPYLQYQCVYSTQTWTLIVPGQERSTALFTYKCIWRIGTKDKDTPKYIVICFTFKHESFKSCLSWNLEDVGSIKKNKKVINWCLQWEKVSLSKSHTLHLALISFGPFWGGRVNCIFSCNYLCSKIEAFPRSTKAYGILECFNRLYLRPSLPVSHEWLCHIQPKERKQECMGLVATFAGGRGVTLSNTRASRCKQPLVRLLLTRWCTIAARNLDVPEAFWKILLYIDTILCEMTSALLIKIVMFMQPAEMLFHVS